MKNILIIGATSAVAENVARIYAKQGACLVLVARNQERLAIIAADLKIRGALKVLTIVMDVNVLDKHQSTIDSILNKIERVDVCLIAHGTLPNQAACQEKSKLMIQALNTNGISTLSLLTLIASHFEKQKSGTIAVITSVAGDRGRQSNYVYGAAKGMVSIFLQGLRNRLHGFNIHVLDIKPGFIDTPMTANLSKNFLWAKPNYVAKQIVQGIKNKKQTLYTPSFWRLIMFIIRQIPESIFKRLTL